MEVAQWQKQCIFRFFLGARGNVFHHHNARTAIHSDESFKDQSACERSHKNLSMPHMPFLMPWLVVQNAFFCGSSNENVSHITGMTQLPVHWPKFLQTGTNFSVFLKSFK